MASSGETSSSVMSSSPPSREELREIVGAIKFAKPDLSQREVHREITEILSDKVPCLQEVKLQDVKKIWKKALMDASENQQSSSVDESATIATKSSEQPLHSRTSKNADLAERLRGKTPQLFTIGDGSKVYQQLAKEYTAAYLAQKAAKEEEAAMELLNNYVHVFLDVPADKSGEHPHQALINFQSTRSKSDTTDTKKGASTDSIIVKIQRAAQNSPSDTLQHPMLLYDQTRTYKTFIHPDPDDDGYEKIANLIAESGTGGALGLLGGTKAYFYARLTKRKKGDILSIHITELAPAQNW